MYLEWFLVYFESTSIDLIFWQTLASKGHRFAWITWTLCYSGEFQTCWEFSFRTCSTVSSDVLTLSLDFLMFSSDVLIIFCYANIFPMRFLYVPSCSYHFTCSYCFVLVSKHFLSCSIIFLMLPSMVLYVLFSYDVLTFSNNVLIFSYDVLYVPMMFLYFLMNFPETSPKCPGARRAV